MMSRSVNSVCIASTASQGIYTADDDDDGSVMQLQYVSRQAGLDWLQVAHEKMRPECQRKNCEFGSD